MHSNSFWSRLTSLATWLFWSPFSDNVQQPIPLGNHEIHVVNPSGNYDYPIFKPPGGRKNWEGSDFECEYPEMPEWEFCSTWGDRSCWLKHPNGSRYDTQTDYEFYAPRGIERHYKLDITDDSWNADGLRAHGAKLVNKTYPGPWIQACWGDRIIVNVTNNLRHNGTAIHWHGIRQNLTTHMDGVPGITQCPIAPGDHFVYNFSAVQYGSSWYHSHYSVQYADGLLGPITIHGPSTAAYDEAKPPLLISDWFHQSAFLAIHGDPAAYPTIVLNGTGDITKFNYSVKPDGEIPPPYTLHFERQPMHPIKQAKKYLLRLINTSFDTAFSFSIDHHLLQIVSSDFVPIEPFQRSHIAIGIGQRYNVIVEAKPESYEGGQLAEGDSFWIRTTNIKCFGGAILENEGYEKTGILRYGNSSDSKPNSKPWPDSKKPICRDEPMEDLVPRLKWKIQKPANGKPSGEEFDVNINFSQPVTPSFPLGHMAFDPGYDDNGWNPLQINYSDPIFLNLDKSSPKRTWPKSWFVVPENYTKDSWVYLAFAGVGGKRSRGAHPIHLHGHDFALLQQESNMSFSPENFKPVLDNPARRDVILLPNNGFAVIAFKTDNPGNWLVHCHIAFHASWGLALQILERQAKANEIWPNPGSPAIAEAERVCKNWQDWQGDCRTWWPGWDSTQRCYPSCRNNNCTKPVNPVAVFQDDSGI